MYIEGSWNRGTPKSPISTGISAINHPAIGVPPLMETPPFNFQTAIFQTVDLMVFKPQAQQEIVGNSVNDWWMSSDQLISDVELQGHDNFDGF